MMFVFLPCYTKLIYYEDRFLLKNVAKLDLLFIQNGKKHLKMGIYEVETLFLHRFGSWHWSKKV